MPNRWASDVHTCGGEQVFLMDKKLAEVKANLTEKDLTLIQKTKELLEMEKEVI